VSVVTWSRPAHKVAHAMCLPGTPAGATWVPVETHMHPTVLAGWGRCCLPHHTLVSAMPAGQPAGCKNVQPSTHPVHSRSGPGAATCLLHQAGVGVGCHLPPNLPHAANVAPATELWHAAHVAPLFLPSSSLPEDHACQPIAEGGPGCAVIMQHTPTPSGGLVVPSCRRAAAASGVFLPLLAAHGTPALIRAGLAKLHPRLSCPGA
jgi:hypothetical protein